MGTTVVILGAGNIGLASLLACIEFGTSNIIVTDAIGNRLSIDERLGATKVIHAKEKNVVDVILRLTNNQGSDVTIETAGNEMIIEQSAYIVREGGVMVAFGLPQKEKS